MYKQKITLDPRAQVKYHNIHNMLIIIEDGNLRKCMRGGY